MRTYIVFGMHGTRQWNVKAFSDPKKAREFANQCELMSEALCVIAQEYMTPQKQFKDSFADASAITSFGIDKFYGTVNSLAREYNDKILELSGTNTLDKRCPLVVYNSPFVYDVDEVEAE